MKTLWTLELDRPQRGLTLRESIVIELETIRAEITELLAPVSDHGDPYWHYAFMTSLQRLAGIDRTIHPMVPALRWTSDGRIRRHLIT